MMQITDGKMRRVRMRGALLALAGAALAGACAAPMPADPPPRPGDPHDVQASAPGEPVCYRTTAAENAIGAAATNRARSRAGLTPVVPNATLARAAQQHACDMAARGRMAHRGSRSSGPAARIKALNYAPSVTAENIAAGPFDLNGVLAEWNRSQGHLANIMIPQTRAFGIGRALGSDGRTVYWSAVYAAPK